MIRDRIEIMIGLWLEWYLGLGCGSIYLYSGGIQAEMFPHFNKYQGIVNHVGTGVTKDVVCVILSVRSCK